MSTQKDFKKIVDIMFAHEQEAELTYPSIKAYKKSISLVVGALLYLKSKKSKGITVYGDFDADGVFSAISLYRFLQNTAIFFHGQDAKDKIKIEFSNRQNNFGITEEEFNKYSENSDLVITVDNGSDVQFLDESLNGKFLVLDHHPSKNQYEFILNPNTGRSKDQGIYSTSGGKVVYDFIMNIDTTLKHFIPKYAAINNKVQLETIKEFAAFTLISDMALMDSENRKFVKEAFATIKSNPNKLPLYSRLKSITSLDFSFNIISQVNAISRMDENMDVLVEWIAPSSMESWKKANIIIDNNNTEKKAAVARIFRDILEEQKANEDKNHKIDVHFIVGGKVGLSGLIANKLLGQSGKTTIIAAVKDDGNIAISGRGDGVKDILAYALEEGKSGGHPNASGGGIDVKAHETPINAISEFKESVRELEKNAPEGLFTPTKLEVASEVPITVSELMMLSEIFKEKSEGVLAYKNINFGVDDYLVDAHHTYASKWALLKISDKETKESIEFFFNTEEINLSEFKNGKNIPIFTLTGNNDYNFHGLISKDEYYHRTKLISEAKEHDIYISDKKEFIQTNTDNKQLDIYYYAHAESYYAFSSLDGNENENDGAFLETLTKEKFEELEQDNLWETEDFPITEDSSSGMFQSTENPNVFLIKELSTSLILDNPDKIFVFPDSISKSFDGKSEFHGLENTIGVPISNENNPRKRNYALSDAPSEKAIIIDSLKEVYAKLSQKKTIVLPLEGLGGEDLYKASPEIYKIIHTVIGVNIVEEYSKVLENMKDKSSELVVRTSNTISDAGMTP